MSIQLVNYQDSKVLEEARSILVPGASTYSVARELNIPQSTVWWHLTHKLRELDYDLFLMVQKVLKNNWKGGGH